MPKESSSGVILYSCSSSASGWKPFLTSMTSRIGFCMSEKSLIAEMPCSFLACTSVLIRSITRSGPTPCGSSVTTIDLRRALSDSTRAVARIRNEPRPVSYASRTPSSPTILAPVGRSGPGTNRIRSSRLAAGLPIRWRSAPTTSTRLCGAMFVAMPTAMPDAPLTSRLGIAAGSTVGSVSRLS